MHHIFVRKGWVCATEAALDHCTGPKTLCKSYKCTKSNKIIELNIKDNRGSSVMIGASYSK